MKLTPYMEMVEAAAGELKTFYAQYYDRKKSIYDFYENFLVNLKNSIQAFKTEEWEKESDRAFRLIDLYDEYIVKRRKHWAEYQMDFDELWEKQALMRGLYPPAGFPEHPLFKQISILRDAEIPPEIANQLIDNLKVKLINITAHLEDELKRVVAKGRFRKEEAVVLREMIQMNPKAAQKLLTSGPLTEEKSSDTIDASVSLEHERLQAILAAHEQIKRLGASWFNPFMPNKSLLMHKQAAFYQLIHNFYDPKNEGKGVEDVVNEWLGTATKFEKQPTSYQTLIGYHRNFFFKRNRPEINTASEEVINKLKTYHRPT